MYFEDGSSLPMVSMPLYLDKFLSLTPEKNGIIYLFKSFYKWNLALADPGGTFRFNFWYLFAYVAQKNLKENFYEIIIKPVA